MVFHKTVTLRKCSNSDLDDLINIGRQTYYDTFNLMNSTETMEKYLDEAFNTKKIEAELKNPDSTFYMLLDKDESAAYIKVNFAPAQSDINDPESMELERIYVQKEYKRKGFGKLLIEKAVSCAVDEACKYIWLGVYEKNEPALIFYKKMGFEIFDKHKFRMGDELQQDYLLRKYI